MQWTVGRVRITRIVELETVGHTRFILPSATHEEIQKLPWLMPCFATEEGRLKMSIHALVVEGTSESPHWKVEFPRALFHEAAENRTF